MQSQDCSIYFRLELLAEILMKSILDSSGLQRDFQGFLYVLRGLVIR